MITIAILAKDKAHTLPIYLQCIERLDYPKDQILLYVRTNDNNDSTCDVLSAWLDRVGPEYHEVFFDSSSISNDIKKYKHHEWNIERFWIIAKIRNDSMWWASDRGCDYFVSDCDNFICPETLKEITTTRLPIVAPLLRCAGSGYSNSNYSNFHAAIDVNGYYTDCPVYYELLNRRIVGLVNVPVVHCTYYIRHDAIPLLTYNDGTNRFEYVMFSDSARKNNIPQYLDTRRDYGWITMAENADDLAKEPWIKEFT